MGKICLLRGVLVNLLKLDGTQLQSKQMELQNEKRLGRVVNKLPIVVVMRIESKEAMCDEKNTRERKICFLQLLIL